MLRHDLICAECGERATDEARGWTLRLDCDDELVASARTCEEESSGEFVAIGPQDLKVRLSAALQVLWCRLVLGLVDEFGGSWRNRQGQAVEDV